MLNDIRKQLTLYANPAEVELIERIRQQYNPQQFELIKAHVTLCREDEIEDLELVISNLLSLKQPELTIEFDEIKRFDNGKGLLLPAKERSPEFEQLRSHILARLPGQMRRLQAHITLMHPRNSTCTNSIFEEIVKMNLPKQLKFDRISLIEQRDGGQWKILQEFDLKKGNGADRKNAIMTEP